GLGERWSTHLEEGFGSDQVVQQRPQERGAALILLCTYLIAVKDFGRVGQLLECLIFKLPCLRQRPDFLELRRVGVVGQSRGSNKMIAGENVGRDRDRGS